MGLEEYDNNVFPLSFHEWKIISSQIYKKEILVIKETEQIICEKRKRLPSLYDIVQ